MVPFFPCTCPQCNLYLSTVLERFRLPGFATVSGGEDGIAWVHFTEGELQRQNKRLRESWADYTRANLLVYVSAENPALACRGCILYVRSETLLQETVLWLQHQASWEQPPRGTKALAVPMLRVLGLGTQRTSASASDGWENTVRKQQQSRSSSSTPSEHPIWNRSLLGCGS